MLTSSVLQTLLMDESDIRSALLQDRRKASEAFPPPVLLRLTQGLCEAAVAALGEGDDETARQAVVRAEALLKFRLGERRLFGGDDWLNLLDTSLLRKDDQQRCEEERREQCAEVLSLSSLLAARAGHMEDAVLAYEGALEMRGGVATASPKELLRLVALLEQRDAAATVVSSSSSSLSSSCTNPWIVHYLSEMLFSLGMDLQQRWLSVEAVQVVLNGSIDQRREYMAGRIATALQYGSILLRLAVHGAEMVKDDLRQAWRTSRAVAEFRSHRVTLLMGDLQRFTLQELGDDHPLTASAAQSAEQWAEWLSTSSPWSGISAAVRSMSHQHFEQWKYHLQNSRQYAAAHSFDSNGTRPALECIVHRYPLEVGCRLLLMSAVSNNNGPAPRLVEAYYGSTAPLPAAVKGISPESTSRRASNHLDWVGRSPSAHPPPTLRHTTEDPLTLDVIHSHPSSLRRDHDNEPRQQNALPTRRGFVRTTSPSEESS